MQRRICELTCELTAEEIAEALANIASDVQLLITLKIEHKEKQAAMKRLEQSIDARIQRRAAIVAAGKETRPIEVVDEPEPALGLVRTRRLDTGEVIDTRAMSREEAEKVQGALPGIN